MVVPSNADTLDSLLAETKSISSNNTSSNLSTLHLEIGNEYFINDDYSKALEHFKTGLDIPNVKQDDSYIQLLSGIGRANERLNNYDIALEYFAKVIDSKEGIATHSELANAHQHIGTIYKALGDYQKAYQSVLDALHFHTLEKDSSGIGRDYYAIGSIFFYQGRFEQSLENYKKAQEIYFAIDDKRLIYASYAAIGSAYIELGDYEKSYEYGSESLKMAKELDYQLGMAYSLGNLGHVHLVQGNMKLAKTMLQESLNIKSKLNDKWGMIGGNLGLADVYLKCKMSNKAIPHAEAALDLAQTIGSRTRMMEAYQAFEKIYEAQNQFPEAHAYLRKYTELRDSVLNDKTVEEMGQAKKRFEIEKKESEIALLKSQNNIFEQKEKIQQLQTYLMLFFVFVLLISIWFVKSRLNLQKKTNLLLEEKNEKIEYQNAALHETQKQLLEVNILLENNNLILGSKNEEIALKNKQLENSNEDLENFAYVASHDLKEPLRMINSYTALLKRRYNSVLDETGQEFMFFVTDAAKRMNVLLDDLLNYSRVGKNGTMDNMTNVNDVLLIVQSNLSRRLEEENGVIHIQKDNIPTILSNHTQLVQLFQNIISNALKFRGERDPVVLVDCKIKNGQHIFSVKDNGIGIAPEHQERVFEMFKRLHTRDEYEGTGIGLSTCKKIVQKHGGEIWLESEHGVGTTFFFSIPVRTQVPEPMLN